MRKDELHKAFLAPGGEYSPMPFWFWNDVLSEEELSRQIHDFHLKGVDGFVLHPRKGLPRTMEYLSDSYMHYVRFAVEEAARLGMRVVLYDEAMYPSGSAHGRVAAENPAWASRCLTMEVYSQDTAAEDDLIAVCAAKITGDKAEDVRLVSPEAGIYRVPEGEKLLCFREGFSGGTIRGVHEGEDDGEPLAPASADLLNPEAVQAFIRITHERYYEVLGDHFGSTVIAMFTDEPDIVGRNARPGCRAWTPGFLQEFGSAQELPALWLDVGGETENIRRRYRRAVNRRMLRTYYGQLAQWCQEHGIALTGHPAKGWDIGLLRPFQIPGQDVVWRYVGPGQGITGDESVLAKCGADAARHAGRRRNANECFGCCGPDGVQWAFMMDDMKWYMDYLFVRGVNLLYPHAFFYSIRDGRGDERPPDVGPNNLWWPMYDRIAQYMRRLSWLMTDSVNQARVAVLCEEDRMPWKSCIPLYENQIEFNYLELSRLPECALEDGALCIAQQRYTHVIAGDALPDHLPRDVIMEPAAPQLRVSHVVKDGLDFYLLVNEGEETIAGQLCVAAQGAAEWWNAWTGEVVPAAIDAQGRYALTLHRRESIILCVDRAGEPLREDRAAEPLRTQSETLAQAAWRVTRMDTGASVTLTSDAKGCLPGWETIPGWADYSGWAVYETEINAPSGASLDLGRTQTMARIFCDEKELALRLWGPYRCELPAGKLRLRIEVANTMANRMENRMENRPLPSGLLGPVVMEC